MNYLIALLFISWPEAEAAKYKVNNCYQADTDYRPSTIKILNIQNAEYLYKVWFPWQKSWGDEITGKIETIEYNYNVQIKCP
jgi:hypothetical protein